MNRPVILSTRVSEQLAEKVAAVERVTGCSRSQVLRKLVEASLEELSVNLSQKENNGSAKGVEAKRAAVV